MTQEQLVRVMVSEAVMGVVGACTISPTTGHILVYPAWVVLRIEWWLPSECNIVNYGV